MAQALLVRTLFPEAPIKYMPPTKHKEGDIFFSHAYDVQADVVAQQTARVYWTLASGESDRR